MANTLPIIGGPRFRFGLRLVFLVIASGAILLGIGINRSHSQRIVVAQLAGMNAQLAYRHELPHTGGPRPWSACFPAPAASETATRLFGDGFFGELATIVVSDPRVTDLGSSEE
jgi:hypothetical protein